MERMSREDYYLKTVETVSLRGTCDRGRSGAILVKDGRIISAGYVGSPSGTPHCDDVGHEIHTKYDPDKPDGMPKISHHCARTVHAEMNAILQCARYGPPCEGSTLFCTMMPCYGCAKAIINAGIQKVYAMFDYHDSSRSKQILDQGGVQWIILNDEVMTYKSD